MSVSIQFNSIKQRMTTLSYYNRLIKITNHTAEDYQASWGEAKRPH